MPHHQMVERFTADDGFSCEIWERPGLNGQRLFYATSIGGRETLLGGCCSEEVDEIKRAINLPR